MNQVPINDAGVGIGFTACAWGLAVPGQSHPGPSSRSCSLTGAIYRHCGPGHLNGIPDHRCPHQQ